jgi:SAM-dependent methyltransferase
MCLLGPLKDNMVWKGFKDYKATILIDLSRSEEELWNGLKKDARRYTKKALENGIAFEESMNWEEFYPVYEKIALSGGINPISLESLKRQPLELLIAKKDKTLIGGVVMGLENNVPYMKINAVDPNFQDLYAGYFVYWNMILWAKRKGYKKLDLGGYQLKGKDKLGAINAFKEKWGGEVVITPVYSKNPAYILGRKLVRNSKFFKKANDLIKGRPMKKDHKSKIEDYSSENSLEHYRKRSNMGNTEKEIIKKYFSGKILDLGCGCGRTTKYLFDERYDVVGVDIIPEMISAAKKDFLGIDFRVGDACKLEFENERFDVVFFSFNGLDYIYPESKRIQALKEIDRVLKKGGYFVYSSHNSLALLKRFRPKFWMRNLFRLSLFSKYKYENEGYGKFYVYYGQPKKQIALVESSTSFKLKEFINKEKGDISAYYVFQKTK